MLTAFTGTLLLTACTDNTNTTDEYTTRIAELEKEVQELQMDNKELAQKNAELSIQIANTPDIATADRNTRKVIEYLNNRDFEGLKEEFGAEFTINETEDEIAFTLPSFESTLPLDLFKGFAYLNYIISGENVNETAYFIDYDVHDRSELIEFSFDSNWKLLRIDWGH